MATLPGLRTSLTLESAQFTAGINRANQSLNSLNRTAGLVKGALGGLIGAFSVRALIDLGRGALDAAGNLGEAAQAAGTTTRHLQELTVAGLQVGVSQEQLVTSLGQFSRRVGEAAQGTGTLGKTLKQYNIEIRNAQGGTRQSADILGDLAEAVQNASSAQEQARIASEAFGARVGLRLVPLLSQGREGLEAMAKAARDAGLVFSGDLIAAADQASDAIATLQYAVGKGFQSGVVQAFAGSVSSSTAALSAATSAGVTFGQAIGTALRAGAETAAFVARHFESIKSALIGLVAVKATQYFLVLGTAIRAAAAAMAAFNLAALANPFTIISVGVGLAVAALVKYQDQIEEIAGFTYSSAFTGVWVTLKERIEGAGKAVGAFIRLLGELATLDFAGALEAAKTSAEGLGQAIQSPIEGFKAAQKEIRDNATLMVFNAGAGENLAQAFEAIDAAARQAGGGVGDLNDKLGAALQTATEELAQLKALQDAYNGVGPSVETVTKAIEIQNKLTALGVPVEGEMRQALLGRFEAIATLRPEVDALAASQSAAAATAKSLAAAQKELAKDATTQLAAAMQLREALDAVTVTRQSAAGSDIQVLAGDFELALTAAQNAIAINEKLAAVGKTRHEAEKSGLLAELEIEQQITRENAKRQDAFKASQEFNKTLDATIANQRLLLRFAGEETTEYQTQIALREAQLTLGRELTADEEKRVRLAHSLARQNAEALKSTAEQEAAAKRAAELMLEPFKNAINSIQGLMTSTFETIYSGGIKSFSDLGDEIKRIFIRLAAEITTLMIFRPTLAAGLGAAGVAGAAGPSLAQSLAGPGAAGAGAAGIAGWRETAVGFGGPPAIQPVGLLGSTGFLGSNITGTQALLAGGLGAAGGSILGPLLGLNSTGSMVGGGLGSAGGALLGSIFPGVGTVLGAVGGGLLGGLGGGFLGNLFGGGSTGNESGITGGALGTISGSGLPAQFARDFDTKLIELLDDRQRAIADRMLKNAAGVSVKFQEELSAGDQSRLAAGRLRPIAQGLGFRASAIAGGGRTPEEQLAKLVEALNVQQQVKDLTSGFGAFAQQARALRRQFDELTASAKEFGISRSGLAKAQKEAGFDLIRQQLVQLGGVVPTFRDQWKALKGEFDDVSRAAKQFGFSLSEVNKAEQEAIAVLKEQRRLEKASAKAQIAALTGNRFENELAQLNQQFAEGYRLAKQYGLSTRELAQAQKDATTALKAQQRAQTDALALSVVDPFQRLADPLKAFQQQLSFENLNPAGQIAAAEADFQRIANLALAGSTTALQQLQGAGQLFIEQAGRFGASPAQVAAREQVASVIESVLADLDRAQREASRGIEDEIRSASRRQVDTLKEIVAEVREVASEIKKLRRT